MGNQPNNFVQCGFDNREVHQQANMTREQAVKETKEQRVFKPQFVQSKVSSVNVNNEGPYIKRNQINTKPIQTASNLVKKQQISSMIPEHQGIIKVSKTPKNRYIKVPDSPYFEEARGKCLDEIIESRYNSNMHFPEYQIISLTQTLVYSLAYMTKKNMNYHDFYPTNIFYNNGSFRIANPLTIKFSGYSLTQQRKRFTFLSPQLIVEILNDKPELDIRKDVMDKSDVFAIGMILLEFCTLQPSSQCYDPETYSIVDAAIQQRIDKTNSLYNPLIGQCIDLMLQYEVDKRISPIDLAYIVHSKVGQIKANSIDGEASRIQQNSRVTMSAKIIPPQLQQGPVPQGSPPRVLGQDQNFNGMARHPSPFIINSNPQIPSNATMRMNAGYNQNISNIPESLPFYTTNPNNTSINPQMMRKPMNSYQQNGFDSRQRNIGITPGTGFAKPEIIGQKVSAVNQPIFVQNQIKLVNSIPSLPQLPNTYSIAANQNIVNNRPPPNITATSASKIKSNPFDQIKQDLKGEQQDSPQKFIVKINGPPPPKPSDNQKFMAYKSAVLNQYQQKNRQNTTLASGQSYSTSTSSSVGTTFTNNPALNPKKEQSLDQRVRRILQASQNIK